MKRLKKILVLGLMVLGLCGALLPGVVYADDGGCVDTNLFGRVCDDGQGGGINMLLEVAYTVMTFGVGILGTVGIVIAGIQYATAADNEQQMKKAKTRIVQIVIGMAVWIFLTLILAWLVPGFKMPFSSGS